MEKSKFIIAGITWNPHGWRKIYHNKKAGAKPVQKYPGNESFNFDFNKKDLDYKQYVFGYSKWNGYPRRFEEPGIIFFFTKNLDENKNQIVGVYGNARVVKPPRRTKWDGFEKGYLHSMIKAEKEKSILFPEYLDADRYKDYSGWDRLVGQFGMRYISQELAVKILDDEIEKVEALGSVKKKELDKLYSIMLIIGEDKQTKNFFDDDEIPTSDLSPKTRQSITTTRIRNASAVTKLKALYGNKCQVSGEKYAFKKTNGQYYSEAHHLIHLGKGGADSEYNIVILSPLIHRMMHYADVDKFTLKDIGNNQLPIRINGVQYTIKWHPDHAKTVKKINLV